jgi:hypothetical protein
VVPSDAIVVKYYGRYNATCFAENGGLIAELKELNGTSGRVENLLNDDTILTIDDAESKAESLLSKYCERERRISLDCLDFEKSALLTLWPINKPNQDIVGDYVVTERTISAFGPDKLAIQCKLNNKNYIPGYGRVFKKRTKSVGKNTRVYRRSVEYETITVQETASVEHAGLLYYPVPEGSTLMSIPALDGMGPRGTL